MKFCNCCFILLTLFFASGVSAQPNKYYRLRIPASPDVVRQWNGEGILPAHFHYSNDTLEIELNTSEMNTFKRYGIPYRDISNSFYSQSLPGKSHGDNERLMGAQSAPVNFSYGSMNGYYTYTEAMAVLDEMRLKFPSLVSAKDTLGLTYEGRPIVAVRISDSPDVQESNEDEWLMTGMHHANEVMGQQVVIYFAWFLLENYASEKEIRTLLNNSALYIVPVVNPDGLAYNELTNPAGGGGWRKNRKPRVISSTTHYGVDLNRNYGYQRAYTHPGQLGQAGSSFAGNDYYRGTAAWSEAETSALREFCKKHRFTAAFNYHAWDDSFNYPWNYDIDLPTSDHAKFLAIADYCTEDNHFEKGTFNRTLGYTANGTSDDWLYGEQMEKNKIFAFTIEVGKSFWPSQSVMVQYCDSLLQANMKMLRMAAKYAPATETSADSIASLSHYISFDIKRYSITDTNYTVSITALDPVIVSTAAAKVYNDLAFLGTRSDTIAYLLSPSVTNGTSFRFLLKVDNGMWSVTDTITKVFSGNLTLPIGCTDYAEPNNTAGNAKEIIPEQAVTGLLDYDKDEDWFVFENTAFKKNIRIVLSDLPADYDIELFTSTGEKLMAGTRPYKLNDTIVLNTNKTGRFKIRIYGYKKAWHPFNCYALSVSLGNTVYPLPAYNSPKDKDFPPMELSVYPMPASDKISVSIKNNRLQTINWIIADNTGRLLRSGHRKINKGLSVFTIAIQDFPAGIYQLRVLPENAGNLSAVKIIKI